MKSFIIIITITCIIASTLGYMPAQVVAVEDDLITVETSDGNLWDFYGKEFAVGENVWILMVDDMILEARRV